MCYKIKNISTHLLLRMSSKWYVWLLWTLVITTFFSCSSEDMELTRVYDNSTTPYITNHPLRKNAKTLRVLAIGNSYTIDGTAYLPELLDGLGIDPASYAVFAVVAPSASLEYWDDVLQRNEPVLLRRRAGYLEMGMSFGRLQDILSLPWDVIVFQQVSYLSVSYESFYPYLHHLIDAAKKYCTNENMTLAWHLTHAYASHYGSSNGIPTVARWQSIAGAVRSMVKYDGIDVIIPMGTAIENARLTNLCTATELTRDGTHLSFGTARYVASCVWVGALFTPVFGCQLSDIKTNRVLEDWEIWGNEEVSLIPGSSVAVTDDNRKLCIRCAEAALKNPFTIIDVKSEK